MKRLSLLLGLAVMLGLSMTAFGQSDPQIVFTGGTESSFGSFGTGLYSGTLNGVATQFICDDATHEISSGDMWNTNAWSISQAATANNGAFAGGSYATASGDAPNNGGVSKFTVPQAYSAVAYLANLLFTGADSAYVNEIQYAIWQIMDDPGNGPGNNSLLGGSMTTIDTAYWVLQGKANDTYTNASIFFYSPDGSTITCAPSSPGCGYVGDTPQEFIGETPEPISMALMGTFLSLAGFGLGKRKLFSKQ